MGDGLGAVEIVGDAVAAQAREEDGEALVIARVPPRDRGIVGEAARERVAVGGVVDEDAIEQELDADVGDGAARAACAAVAIENGIELAHQAGDDGQAVKRAVRRVVERDAGGDLGIGARLDACPGHRREVGEHCAERHARTGTTGATTMTGSRGGPARDRRVAEVVHASYYHLPVLVIGIDLGTQSCKAVVCDAALTVRGQHAVGYETSHPQPGQAEQDPRIWEAALAPTIAGALAAARASADDILAVAIAGQLDGCIAVDTNGAALHPALIWQDRRAIAEASRADATTVFALTGQVADASHMAPKLLWLQRNGVRAARYHQPVSYLVEQLTGSAVIDPSLASTTMLLELATAR